MDIDNNFPIKLFTVDDVPEPFRGTLKDNLSPNERVLLIYSPAFCTLQDPPAESAPVNVGKILMPATVLAVTDDRWLVTTEEEDGVIVEQSAFRDTLFLELTSILLSGELKIYYASVDTHYVATVHFNTVREEFYREAIGLILDGIDQKDYFLRSFCAGLEYLAPKIPAGGRTISTKGSTIDYGYEMVQRR